MMSSNLNNFSLRVLVTICLLGLTAPLSVAQENALPQGLMSVCVNRKRNSRSLHFARDDKGKGNGYTESGCWTEALFHHLGWAAGP